MSARDKFEAWPREMAKHTPGQWVQRPADGCIEIYAGEPLDMVCTVEGGNQSTDEANARLMAAAPDLLAALRMWDTFMQNNYRQSDMPDMWQATVDALQKAGAGV